MEKNYLNHNGHTHFYVDLEKQEYGVKVSIKETKNSQQIIDNF